MITKYISFDIFDTLIFRKVLHPHDLFDVMSRKYDLPENFRSLRIEAERKAHAANRFETIYDIYEGMDIFASSEEKKHAAEQEIQAEVEICVPNEYMVKKMRNLTSHGYHVLLISDMYLPTHAVESILSKCGITGYEKLYVSCDCKAEKTDGSLFKYVLNDLGIKPGQLTHIGDNKKSDFMMPKTLGIMSQLYKASPKSLSTNSELTDSIQKFAYVTYQSTESIPQQFGYQGMGPLLYGFSRWLQKSFHKDHIDKVFFLSRDGKIMERAYRELGDDSIPYQYLYASRRALIVPTIWNHADLKEACKLFFTSKGETVRSFLSKLGLDSEEYAERLSKYGLKLDDILDVGHIEDTEFSKFYEDIKEEVVSNSKGQFELLKDYLTQSGFKGNVAIVDIGWYGNMQRSICELAALCDFDVNISGYYIGVVPNSPVLSRNPDQVMHGYLFEPGRDQLFQYEKSFNAIIEWIFSATHGTVLGYMQGGAGVEPVLDEYEFDAESSSSLQSIENEKEVLTAIQDSAIEFVKNICSDEMLHDETVTPEQSFSTLTGFATKPTDEAREFFGNLRFKAGDSKYHYLARPEKLSYYMTHRSRLKSDMRYTGWRVGFVRRLMPLPLPYDEIYFSIRKLAKKY